MIGDSGKRKSNNAVIWECKCDCGNIAYCDSSNLKRGHTTSCGCKVNDYIDSMKIDIIGKKYGLLTVIKELERSQYKRRTYLCKCDCGHEIIVDGASVTTGHTFSCGCIKQSYGEYIVESILKEIGIPYEKEKRFDDCRNAKTLPFDFYLPTKNVCIEYNGKQHYCSVDYWGGDDGFEARKKNDQIKQKYCCQNNIGLIVLPYTMKYSEIKNMILNV